MKLSVIVVFYNAEATLLRCLSQIARAIIDDAEVILVDDGSTDTSYSIAKQFPYQILRNEKRRGPAFSRNLGATHARGEIITFVDSDVLVRSETFRLLLNAFIDHPDISGASAVYSDKPVESGLFQEFKTLEESAKYQAYQADCYDSFDPHCASIKRDAFLSLGGFNTNYHGADTEDVEFGYKLRSKGYRNIIVKHAKVDHVYSPFFVNIRNYLRRTFLWTRLFLKKRTFDQAVTTKTNACSVFLTTLVGLSFGISFLNPAWAMVTIWSAYFHFMLNLRFWRLGYRRHHFTIFLRFFTYAFYLFTLQISIGLGALSGFIIWPLSLLFRCDPYAEHNQESQIMLQREQTKRKESVLS